MKRNKQDWNWHRAVLLRPSARARRETAEHHNNAFCVLRDVDVAMVLERTGRRVERSFAVKPAGGILNKAYYMACVHGLDAAYASYSMSENRRWESLLGSERVSRLGPDDPTMENMANWTAEFAENNVPATPDSAEAGNGFSSQKQKFPEAGTMSLTDNFENGFSSQGVVAYD